MDPLADFPDSLLGPLPACSDPSVHGRPRLIRNPIPPQLLTQGGLGDLILAL